MTEVPKVETESKNEDKPKEKPKPNTDNIEFEITNPKSGEQGSLF
ncbi:MAG: hypothetical protein R2728_14540 [Chitinophagales bacterium]